MKYFIHESSRKWIFGFEYVCGGIKELAAGQKSSAKKDMAVNYLHTILAENDVASVKIFEEMSRYGFSKRTVQNAKKEAGIQAYKKGNAWYWHMERGAADDGTGSGDLFSGKSGQRVR